MNGYSFFEVSLCRDGFCDMFAGLALSISDSKLEKYSFMWLCDSESDVMYMGGSESEISSNITLSDFESLEMYAGGFLE